MIKKIMDYDEKKATPEQLELHKDFYSDLKIQQMKTIKLTHLGRSFVLMKNKNSGKAKNEKYNYNFQEIDSFTYFHDLVFTKKMIKYHFPHLYEEGLSSKLNFLQKFK